MSDADTQDLREQPTEEAARPPRASTLPVPAGGGVRAIAPQSLHEVARLADVIAQSGLAPYGMKTAQQVAVAIMYGAEIGLPPMQAVQSIAVINGRPSIYGDAGVALVRSSGLLEVFEEGFTAPAAFLKLADFPDEFAAWVKIKRVGDPRVLEEQFSVADAKLAGLWEKRGNNGQATPWITHPKRMLRWRARSFAFRDMFADVLRGLAFTEEVRDLDPLPPMEEAPPSIASRLPGSGAAVVSHASVEEQINGNREEEHAEDGDEGVRGGSGGASRDDGGGGAAVANTDADAAQADADGSGPEGQAALDLGPKTAAVSTDRPAALTEDEKTLLADIQKAVNAAASEVEVEIVAEEFADSIERAGEIAQKSAAKLFDDRKAAFEKKSAKAKPKKSAASERL